MLPTPLGTPLAAAVLVASLLYCVAFCGVAFMAEQVAGADGLVKAGASDNGITTSTASTSSLRPEYDSDVVIVGAGLAGTIVASVLARQGKRVTIIEPKMNMMERIVGELLQPGGIRALERMGLSECAKTKAIDSVHVEGYSIITPGTPPSNDLILTYPSHDPATLKEYMGVMAKDTRLVKVNKTHAGGKALAGMASVESNVIEDNRCKVTGVDLHPRGRSFHYHLFVLKLRQSLLDLPNVTIRVGAVSRVLTANDLKQDTAGKYESQRPANLPAPVFAGYDEHDVSKGTFMPAVTSAMPTSKATAHAPLRTGSDTVVGVTWRDEATKLEHVTTGRLTVVADGMFSTFRNKFNIEKPTTLCFMCGLLLHHPPFQTPLPYPHRGHVVLADPHPVLLYQISSTETRVLVDVPAPLPSIEDGTLRKYFVERIAPQLPESVRPFFLEAANTQEPYCMPIRPLTGQHTEREGAILLGDSWNMRHPLTGGGMTVAIKDSEMLCTVLRDLDLQTCSWEDIRAAVDRFQEARASHAATINVLANALRAVFSRPASDDSGTRSRLRAACIDYLSCGGACTAGPVGLLSGLTPKPAVLVSHFFAVAVHAMKLALLPFPTPKSLMQGYDLMRVACVIIMPLLESEKATFLSSAPVLALSNLVFPWRGVSLE